MRRPLALSLLLLPAAAAVWAAGTVDLSLRLAPSTPWKVRQTLELRVDTTGGAVTAGNPAERNTAIYEVQYTDRSAADKGFKHSWTERVYAQARMRVGKDKPEASALEGCTIKMEKGEETYLVETLKGKPGDAVLEALKPGPPDPIQLLLPDHPVKAGDTWEVSGEQVARFHALCALGFDDAKGEALKALIAGASGLLDPKVAVTARVRAASPAEATIDYSAGQPAAPGRPGKPGGAIKPGETGKDDAAPPAGPPIIGSLRFHVKDGRPISLDWRVGVEPKPAGKPAAVAMGAQGGGGGATLVLSRKYEPGK